MFWQRMRQETILGTGISKWQEAQKRARMQPQKVYQEKAKELKKAESAKKQKWASCLRMFKKWK